MARIRSTFVTASLLLAVIGVPPLASGQNNNKQKYSSPPRAYSPPPRAYTAQPRQNYAPHVNTPPAVNSPQQIYQHPPITAPNTSPGNSFRSSATPTTGGSVTNPGPRNNLGRIEATTPPVHTATPSVGYPSSQPVTGVHPPAYAKVTPPMRPAYTLPASGAIPKNPTAPAPLDKSVSKSVVQQVNTARSSMSGINARPLPQGKVLLHPNGALTVEGSGGRQYHVRQDGTVAGFEAHGVRASFRPDGTISAVHTSNMQINYSANGNRRVETIRPDHSVLVSTGAHQGYLQRTVVVNNKTIVQRTYVVNNTTYVRTYTAYAYRGVMLEHYVPAVYYAPAFYGWVYYPWPRPVPYRWGFVSDPWYGYYGGYFAPAPVYSSASLWLIDYSLAQMLGNAYQDRPATVAPKGVNYAQSDTAISPDTKQLLAAQVQEMVAAENKAAGDPNPENKTAGELPDLVKHERSVFVVASNLDVTSENGECGLTAGDILEMDAPLPNDVLTANVRVISSKRMDCPASSMVSVSLGELQEMHNELRQRVDEGMKVLRTSQGSGGIPAVPPDAIAPPPRPNYVTDAGTVSGEQVVAMIAEQQQTADTTPQVIQNEFGG